MTRTTSAEPRKRPRQRRSVETVDRILAAAARIFDERGYHGTTTNHVAEAAGVSIGSLYQYFPNKDALLVALAERHVDEAAERFGEQLTALRRDQPDLAETVRSLVRLAVELNDTSRLHATVYAECPRTPALIERFNRVTDLLVTEVAWHLERTGGGSADTELRARLVVAAVDAAVHEVVLALPAGDERRRAAEELVALTVDGLGGRSTTSG